MRLSGEMAAGQRCEGLRMNIWEILGIPPTTDVGAIKQAYASRAKEWHPEEHPEEFKRLRNAYKTAVSYAKSGGVESQPGTGAWSTASAGEWGNPGAGKETEQQAGKEIGKQAEEEADNQAEGKGKETAENTRQAGRRSAADDAEFSYDDVSAFYQKELAERFFRDFKWIACNPYLQNLKAFWSYLLFQVNYEDLYYHEGFRQKLLHEICTLQGWHRETLDHIQWWLDLYREADREEIPGADAGNTGKGIAGKRRADSRKETDSRRWQWKKKWSRLPHLSPENVVTKEQRGLHYEILTAMRERGYDTSLLTAASAETYMEYYRAFVEDGEKWLESQRRKNVKKRRGYWTAIWASVCLVTVLLVWELAVKPAVRAEQAAALREQQEQEEAVLHREQEQREQEEWQRELEERFQTMQEQYEEWMKQE